MQNENNEKECIKRDTSSDKNHYLSKNHFIDTWLMVNVHKLDVVRYMPTCRKFWIEIGQSTPESLIWPGKLCVIRNYCLLYRLLLLKMYNK